MYIYSIINLINNKKYVGLSTRDHNKHLWYYGSGDLIKLAIKKYGKENFKKEILEHGLNLENITDREIFWINELNTIRPNGYNIINGGNANLEKTQETRNKLSKINKGRTSPNKGKTASDETKKRQSESRKNPSPETRKKLSDAKIGKHPTIETRNKISNALKGLVRSDETRKKISIWNKNRSEAANKKISDGRKNKKKVKQINKITNEVIDVFDSIFEAGLKTGCLAKKISLCVNNKRKTTGGYRWELFDTMDK